MRPSRDPTFRGFLTTHDIATPIFTSRARLSQVPVSFLALLATGSSSMSSAATRVELRGPPATTRRGQLTPGGRRSGARSAHAWRPPGCSAAVASAAAARRWRSTLQFIVEPRPHRFLASTTEPKKARSPTSTSTRSAGLPVARGCWSAAGDPRFVLMGTPDPASRPALTGLRQRPTRRRQPTTSASRFSVPSSASLIGASRSGLITLLAIASTARHLSTRSTWRPLIDDPGGTQ